jgi:hypothetical protein
MGILNDQFKVMTEAQKSFVLSMLVNKTFQNPKDYGFSEDGIMRVGDKLDFTKLFEDAKEIKSIFDKARETITPGSPQEKSILANNEKIANWVKNNPGAKITSDKVADILNGKPKTEAAVETIPVPPRPAPEPIATAMSVLDKEYVEKRDKEQTHMDIAKAKGRIAELEALETKDRNPNLERSLTSDSRSIISDSRFNQNVEVAFRSEIDNIYGKKGFAGMGRVAGVNTKEWGEMARLPASKIVEYYTGDSAKSGLPADIVEKLSKSKGHNNLMKQAVGLMEQSNGAVKPFENENMEQFIKRLGGYVLRTHPLQNLQKAA